MLCNMLNCVFCSSNYWIGLWLPDPLIGCGACQSQLRTVRNVSDACALCRKRWTWQDGSAMLDSRDDMVFDAWFYNEPTGGQNCARLSKHDDIETHTWKDVQCSMLYNYICKSSEFTHEHDASTRWLKCFRD